MKIFLSYSSKDKKIAEKIYHSIIQETEHEVFFDTYSLKPAQAFHSKIEDEIKNCDLFLFLISNNSIREGSYTLTEIEFARQTWKKAENHVLPVRIDNVTDDNIPPYIKSIGMLRPKGNIEGEVVSEIRDIEKRITTEKQDSKSEQEKSKSFTDKKLKITIIVTIAVGLFGGVPTWLALKYNNTPEQPSCELDKYYTNSPYLNNGFQIKVGGSIDILNNLISLSVKYADYTSCSIGIQSSKYKLDNTIKLDAHGGYKDVNFGEHCTYQIVSTQYNSSNNSCAIRLKRTS